MRMALQPSSCRSILPTLTTLSAMNEPWKRLMWVWALLHELDHIANDSQDANAFGETGECESRINQMRVECNLPQRIDYFYTFSPLTRNTTSAARLVRLAFEERGPASRKKGRLWIVWDARLVGGLNSQRELAELR